MKQLPLAIGVEREPSFDGFLTDRNEAAIEGLLALKGCGPPVYLWGPQGSGKSHLLQALRRRWFGWGVSSAAFGAQADLPWLMPDGCGLLVLDDAEGLDEARQHAAFTLFVEAAARGVQMVCAGRLPPIDLPLRDDVRTRLAWGLVFRLQPLPELALREALVRAAARNGLSLGQEVLDFVLARYARDLGSLMDLLDRLDRYALVRGRPITIPLVRDMLAEEATHP